MTRSGRQLCLSGQARRRSQRVARLLGDSACRRARWGRAREAGFPLEPAAPAVVELLSFGISTTEVRQASANTPLADREKRVGASRKRCVQSAPYPPSGDVHAGCDWWKKSSSCRSVSSARDASVLWDPSGE